MSNHDHLSNIGLHPAYDPDPAVHVPVRVEALRKRIVDATAAVESYVGLKGRTVTVTIGRNVDDGRGNQGPMPDVRWVEFCDTVAELLDLTCPEFRAAYFGDGSWQGVPEHSCTFVASGIRNTTTTVDLSSALSDLARRFGQDAIALTVGDTTLVES